MNRVELERLLDVARRRKLTAEEETRLEVHFATHPVERESWEEETGLTGLLDRLPDAPLASNFTARVLQAAELEARKSGGTPRLIYWLGLNRPAYQLAWTCLALGMIGAGYYVTEIAGRAKLARSLVTVAEGVNTATRVVELPGAEAWQDFESIRRLGQSQPQADLELLAALK